MKPLRFLYIALSVVGLMLLLSACGNGISFSSPKFNVQTNPNAFVVDIDVDDKGLLTYKNTEHIFTFSSEAGAIGAHVTGYDIEFLDSSNNPLFIGDPMLKSSGSLDVYIPAGLTCNVDVFDPRNGCTWNSAGATPAPGPKAPVVNGVLGAPAFIIPVDIALQLYGLLGKGGAVGAHGLIYFYGVDDVGRTFRTPGYQFALIIV
jgi:hypothetical protein